MKKYFTFLIMLINISIMAQTPTPMSGSFTVNGETFNCRAITARFEPNSSDKILFVYNSRTIDFPESTDYSATCTPLERKKECRRYSLQKNKPNAMQITRFLKTVFSPQRCAQLGNKRFDIGISIFPSTNVINGIAYTINTEGTDTYVTQEEIAQLDHLIRTVNFTYPKIKGTYLTVGSIGINGVEFKFNELYTDPWLNGTDSLWDDYQQRTD